MGALAMALLVAGNVAFFAWTAKRRWRQLLVGNGDARVRLATPREILLRIEQTIVYALGQKKMPNYPLAGFAHILVFAGFCTVLLRNQMLIVRGFDEGFDFFGLFAHGTVIGDGYSLIKDVFGVLTVVGALVFVWFRVVRREKRMTLSGEGLLILGIIVTMMVADMVYDGATLVRQAAIGGTSVHFNPWEPVGSLFGFLFQPFKESTSLVRGLQHAGFWTHASLIMFFGNLLPYSKHFHIITSFPNVFTHTLEPAGKLPKIEDLEGKVEREEAIGWATIKDTSWKDVLDLYTCTECGRCSDNCPAFTTGKKLSPKHITLALRDHLFAANDALFEGKAVEPKDPETLPDIHSVQHEQLRGAYHLNDAVVELVPNVVHPDVIWACTTCRACEEQCPVMISYVDKIVEMRRERVMMKSEFPGELQKPFRGMETNGNPWNLPASERASWADGLDVAFLADKPDAKVLYWVGCAASFDDRAKKIARATAKLLSHAGVDFAILGLEEQCTGDPARRAGNEYLFQVLAQANVETLNGYGVDKKQVITTCPHCFNTLLNEYPDFGGRYEVVHHADFLMGLVTQGKLAPTKRVDAKVAYHDSCYLGRYNGIYDSPRDLLRAIPGVQLEEVPYWSRNKGLCCGAGGAQMFMEEQNDDRVNKKRLKQLVDTGATTVASACPFCMTMLTDGIKAFDLEAQVQQLDIAEMLERSVDFTRTGQAAHAHDHAAE